MKRNTFKMGKNIKVLEEKQDVMLKTELQLYCE